MCLSYRRVSQSNQVRNTWLQYAIKNTKCIVNMIRIEVCYRYNLPAVKRMHFEEFNH